MTARPRAAFVLAALACAFVAARVPALVADVFARGGKQLDDARKALTMTRDELVEATAAVPPDLEALLRSRLGTEGRLVAFLPLGEMPEAARRLGEATLLAQYDCLRNLLYPEPRDVRMARDAGELRGFLEPRFAGRLLVADFGQQGERLPVPGTFELLRERRIGSGRARWWLLREGGR